ncbi:M3 family metallopeptidase [Alphaproteobacteria bacterium KMM 3653]|uniref:M3 family metallopeptidase n=1 Tax=Harenicola maris TaxID=2841044 RepID=A0AAP2CQP2_9RHOB|nr:M3 family metallopeptidase [Harenicola maris]
MTNPLLTDWDTPFELPPFGAIEDAHYQPAFDAALAEARAETQAIADQEAPATFDNTIKALERAGHRLGQVLSVFYTVSGVDSTEERQALQRAFSPKLAEYSSWVALHEGLFARVDDLYQRRDALDLGPEEARVLELHHRYFRRAGALLAAEKRGRLAEINEELANLGTAFGQNLLADERDWSMALDAEGLKGLPQFLVDAAASAAQEKGVEGHVVTLSRSLIVPFLQFSPNRALRQRAFEAWAARGANGGETDNRGLCAQMLALRHERAQMLGYENFAAYKLETEMAKTPANVRGLLNDVWAPAKAAADADAAVLTAMLEADGEAGPLEPWDWRYYSEKRRVAEHDLDEALLKPYFQLDRMIDAAFDCAARLFGLSFAPIEVELHHPDVRAWEVTRRDGEHVAVFLGDYFARSGKRSGAWCSAIRAQQRMDREVRPHVVNVCNFAKPPAGAPALLSYDDARTLFHEFGHALHQMLSDVTFESISGTSVPRDFVELPSQLYEHWLEVPEVLQKFAVHAETGEAMPQALMERVLAAGNYDIGHSTVEYVASAMVDLEFHDGPPPADPMQKQAEVLEAMGMPRAITMRHATPHFAHVFSGGYYAASYYSYMWSEMMDADAFAAFEEAGGPFDAEMAKALEADILSAGGRDEPDVLYTAFRGRLPGIEALLKGRGLDDAA